MDNPMFSKQLDLEAESLNLGITRYRRDRSKKDESDLKPGKVLVHRVLDALVDRINETVADLDKGKARGGKPSVYGRYLKEIPPEAAAFITAKVAINHCVKPNAPLLPVAMSVGTLIEEHIVFSDLADTQPGLFTSAQRKVRKATTAHHKRYTMRHAVGVAVENHGDSVTGLSWTDNDKAHLGIKLIELLVDTAVDHESPLFEVGMVYEKRKRKRVLRATDATLAWIAKIHSNDELLAPVYLPMIVPPRNWHTPLDGGYMSTKVPFVKTKRKGTIDELFSSEMPGVYAAVNSIQSTPWRINNAVLDVMLELNASDSSLGDLPSPTHVSFPAKLANMDREARGKTAAFQEWNKATARAHELKARETSRNVALAQKLFVAQKLRNEPAIYFPHNLDFRGRIYPIPTGLTPQANDHGKGILEFAEGMPLGEDGAFWLAVHIANCFGEDKVSLEDRVQWVHDNEDAILDSSFSPLDGQRFWADADKPFCALAGCFEWAGYRLAGDAFVSHLPIAMDGTCSGLQHYSALLRDPIGGRAVNLVPADTPSDIYSTVAVAVSDALVSSGDPKGLPWLGKVERSIVKQPCMTFAYSSTVVGMRDQIIAALKKVHDTDALEGHDYFAAASYLAPIVRDKIKKCVVAASSAMEWLQQSTKLLSENKQPIVWSTPLGLPVMQANMKSKSKAVQVIFAGARMELNLSYQTNVLDSRSQTNGIAPNYIHSLDSCHLMQTVLGATENGIQDFAMIHDSFGTHACNTSAFNAILRNEFVQMYSGNLLEDFRQELIGQLPEGTEVDPIPPMGDLDIAAVRDSDFFFS